MNPARDILVAITYENDACLASVLRFIIAKCDWVLLPVAAYCLFLPVPI